MREYLSRLRVMAAQSPHDTSKFKKYSTKLFKDALVYTGAKSFEEMTGITNVDACEEITQLHGFSTASMKALGAVTDYDSHFTVQEMSHLLNDYEQIIDRICNE
jgi:hypothetical protein